MTTIAGSGRAESTDGSAFTASFLAPVGIAVAASGTIYVADPAAHVVRRIRGDHVDTYAGYNAAGVARGLRSGGYLDGPAARARFDRPVAVAVGPRGAVYVADAGNHCIRKIERGYVSTYAGSRRNESRDGSAREAAFVDLRGLASDDEGTLYAADYGVGLRKIASDGRVTTLDLPSDKKGVLGVSARGSGARLELAYTDTTHIHVVVGGKAQSVAFDDEREPEASGLVVGHASGIAILNENSVAVTDPTTDAVRFVRLPAPPFIGGRMTRALAGGVREGLDTTGGFADGSPDRARVDAPAGIAVATDGSLVVADTGNRRIRRIYNVDPRESVLPDLSNFTIPERAYHVAIVGNSYAFYNVLWPESLPGIVGAGLQRDAHALGLTHTVAVTAFRIDDASERAASSIVREYLSDGRTQVVVLLLNAFDPTRTATLDELATRLRAIRTKLLVVYTPQGFEVSPIEFVTATKGKTASDFAALRARAAKDEAYYALSGVRGLYLLDAMEAEAARPDRRPLFYGADHHFTIYGTQFVAQRILSELERWKPWQR